jgi:predicted DNA-binding transcriptional regulator AlpA
VSSENQRLLNARQVAEQLNLSIAWVLAHAEGRRLPVLPSLKLGKAVRFRSTDIEDFLERCRRAMAQGRPIH